jgi:hypothetical protein
MSTSLRCVLSGVEAKVLTEALAQAFPRQHELEALCRFELEYPLSRIVGANLPLDAACLAIIEWAEKNDRLDRLIDGALEERKNNPSLRQFVALYRSSLQRQVSDLTLHSMRDFAARGPIGSDHFETREGLDELRLWRDLLGRIERQVCRIELGREHPLGTGFLVANDVVLTAAHVIRGIDLSRLRLRFDWKWLNPLVLDEGDVRGVYGGEPLRLAPPDASTLDYAFLRTQGRPGEQLDNDARPRRSIRPHFTSPEIAGEPVLLVQCPGGSPMKLGIGRLCNWDQNRLYHDANADAGASGSPVFNRHLELVGMHQGSLDASAATGPSQVALRLCVIRDHLDLDFRRTVLGWS